VDKLLGITKIIKKLYSEKKNLYILLAVGIVILISGNILGSSKNKSENIKINETENFNIQNDEKRLEEILSYVDGAGKTKVMITYDTGAEKVIVQNSKISKTSSGDKMRSGGEKETVDLSEERETVMNGSGSSQTPFVSKEITPKVRGVLVVAEGADDSKVKFELTNAVAAVLNVPYYRIQVLKKS